MYLRNTRFGVQAVADPQQLNIIKKDVFLWYQVGPSKVQFKFLQDWGEPTDWSVPQTIFNRFVTSIFYQPTVSELYAFELEVWRKDNRLHELMSVLAEVYFPPSHILKVKFDDHFSLTFLYTTELT